MIQTKLSVMASEKRDPSNSHWKGTIGSGGMMITAHGSANRSVESDIRICFEGMLTHHRQSR